MTIRPETERLLGDVERLAQRKFRHRTEVAWLVELASAQQKQPVMEEIVFLSKFVTKADEVLRRDGGSSEQTAKLSNEFEQNLSKVSILLRSLVGDSADDVHTAFVNQFLRLTHEGMSNLLSLMKELSWFKNYAIDKRGSM
jgi:hypothetical protein